VINVERQIDYWKSAANEDLITADWLIQGSRFKEGLFFCHLAIEKILKALVVKQIKDIPPKTHDLFLLVKKAEIKLEENDLDFLGILMNYQIEGRYPQFLYELPNKKMIDSYYQHTADLLLWMKSKF